MFRRPLLILVTLGLLILVTLGCVRHRPGVEAQAPGQIVEVQGSFFVGGPEIVGPGVFDPTTPAGAGAGQIHKIDQLYTQFQIPAQARRFPLVLVHGGGQTGKSWETTPDGRDGYRNIFLRRGYAIYVVDFPRRGRAGFPSFSGPVGSLGGVQVVPPVTTQVGLQTLFTFFRLGVWPDYFPNVQFSRDPAVLTQFAQQGVPAWSDDPAVVADGLTVLHDKIAPAVMVTHSQSGLFGWLTAMKTTNVRGIVSYEPAQVVLPEGEGTPNDLAVRVPVAEFRKLTRFPIHIVFGDNIPTAPSPVFVQDRYRMALSNAQQFVDAVNRHGGQASLLKLPDVGIRGNTHFPFSDLNNVEVADQLSAYLRAHNLDIKGDEDAGAFLAADAPAAPAERRLAIGRQGSFFVGGTTITAPGVYDPTNPDPVAAFSTAGQTYHVDQLYTQFQIPPNQRGLPLVLVHGGGQTGKTWEMTAEGREGYDSIFLRRDFAVYIVDFPRRGRAGFPSFFGPFGNMAGTQVIPPVTNSGGAQTMFTFFRFGVWPEFYPNVTYSTDRRVFDQFAAQSVPAFTDVPAVVADALAALHTKIGPSVLVSHSQSGLFGWLAATKSDSVRAIVSYEPAGAVFPEGELPANDPQGRAIPVPLREFEKLTRIPIQVVVGDSIPTAPVPNLLQDRPRFAAALAEQFVAAINRHGGRASLLKLPDVGIRGNTHFAFSDSNNVEVADQLSQFLSRNSLDRRNTRLDAGPSRARRDPSQARGEGRTVALASALTSVR